MIRAVILLLDNNCCLINHVLYTITMTGFSFFRGYSAFYLSAFIQTGSWFHANLLTYPVSTKNFLQVLFSDRPTRLIQSKSFLSLFLCLAYLAFLHYAPVLDKCWTKIFRSNEISLFWLFSSVVPPTRNLCFFGSTQSQCFSITSPQTDSGSCLLFCQSAKMNSNIIPQFKIVLFLYKYLATRAQLFFCQPLDKFMQLALPIH